MPHLLSAQSRSPRPPGIMPGLFLAALLAGLCFWLSGIGPVRATGLGAMTLAILGGLLVGNLLPGKHLFDTLAPGFRLTKGPILRTGIVLFGFQISFQAIDSTGLQGVSAAMIMLGSTLALALLVGRALKLPRNTAWLIACGSAICGAAAILAAAQMLRAREEETVTAVATVVLFGTLGMFLYPLVYPWLGLTPEAYGIWVGSSLHEVAQVVVAGSAIGPAAVETSVVVKMSRVLMLVPVLLLAGRYGLQRSSASGPGERPQTPVPWFAVGFVVVVLLNSVVSLSPDVVAFLRAGSEALLIVAMAGLGLSTRLADLRRAGGKALQAGTLIFLFLAVGGLIVTLLVS